MTRFQPGQSGNPAGRKPGKPNRVTSEARNILEEHAAEVLQAAISSALQGDSMAQRLILGLALPKRIRPALELPKLDSPAAAANAMARLVDQAAQGVIEPEEARALSGMIESASRQLETYQHSARFFDAVLTVVSEESPEAARRILMRLEEMRASSANSR